MHGEKCAASTCQLLIMSSLCMGLRVASAYALIAWSLR